MVAADGYLKITDFGLSKDNINEKSMVKSFCGTTEYLAPEVISKNGYSISADWWSFGSIVYEMLCGLPPFYNSDRKALLISIKYEDPDLSKSFLSPEAKDFCQKLLIKDPELRLGAKGIEEIRDHPWFENISWDKIEKKVMEPPYRP